MKKLASILAVTLAAGVLATGCGSSSGSASKDCSSDSGKTVIKAATGANAKPYVYVGDDDKPAGYDVDVLNAVFDKLPDYELEYEVTDFGSVLYKTAILHLSDVLSRSVSSHKTVLLLPLPFSALPADKQ